MEDGGRRVGGAEGGTRKIKEERWGAEGETRRKEEERWGAEWGMGEWKEERWGSKGHGEWLEKS